MVWGGLRWFVVVCGNSTDPATTLDKKSNPAFVYKWRNEEVSEKNNNYPSFSQTKLNLVILFCS